MQRMSTVTYTGVALVKLIRLYGLDRLKSCAASIDASHATFDRDSECWRAIVAERIARAGSVPPRPARERRKRPPEQPPTPLPPDQWPWTIRRLAKLKHVGDRGAGDTLTRLLKTTGI